MSRFGTIALIVAVSAIIGLGRFLVPGHALSWPGTYEASAHIWVGALVTLALAKDLRRAALLCLGVITVLETVMFLLR